MAESGELNWIEAVAAGQLPFGKCRYCGAARARVGCLNMCELPMGEVRRFQEEMAALLSRRRTDARVAEVLQGCTCPYPPRLPMRGYEVTRQKHDLNCPTGGEVLYP